MKPVYVDIHIHTSENPNIPNEDYDVRKLLDRVKRISRDNPVLLSLTDHNMINKSAYLALVKENVNVILGAELHIKKYPDAQPYHCHILFNTTISEECINELNAIFDELYTNKVVTKESASIPNIEDISNAFDNYDFMLLPHGGQSHRTFDKATAPGHRFDTSMERSIYYNHFEGFTARSNSGLTETTNYFKRLGISDFTNLITCSDNYNPEIYPSAKSSDAEDFEPTWMLAEPSFNGLRIALSEKSRLHYGDLPPNDWNKTIGSVQLVEDKCDINVTLTPGLNVVIGGSSSGKTLLVDSIVRGINGNFDDSVYKDFGVSKIQVANPSNTMPHYINQNFIISVLQNGDLNIGDIEIIGEVFPQDSVEKEMIRRSLADAKKLLEKLIDAAKEYEHSLEQLSHINAPSHLIISHDEPNRIEPLIHPKADDTNRFSLSYEDYKYYIDTLENIKDIFSRSKLDLRYEDEIATIERGLLIIEEISSLSDTIKDILIDYSREEIEWLNASDGENARKINQRQSLVEYIGKAIRALTSFYNAKEELESFDVHISTKEVAVNGHKLSIENAFELTEAVLTETINNYLKSDNRVNSFKQLRPENLFRRNFSERPKVRDYEDYVNKCYDSIAGKNKRSYNIETADGRQFDDLSPGWKSAIILDLILGYNGDTAPLIIDQPEDNLATDYINHGLVKQIIKVKPNKQIILVSHNATIPMIGDAQNVIVCQNQEGKIIIRSAPLESTIEGRRVLDYIAEITDGGKPSIRKRVKKYDLKKYREN